MAVVAVASTVEAAAVVTLVHHGLISPIHALSLPAISAIDAIRKVSDHRAIPKLCTTHAFSYVVGHWIQDCPTNDDREFDNRPRVKRTTGIPRSFLKAVDISAEGAPAKGVMVTPEGGFVVAEPDS